MFIGVIVVCGLNIPGALDGCGAVSSKVLFPAEEACQESLVMGAQSAKGNIPDGAYVADAQCFQVAKEV